MRRKNSIFLFLSFLLAASLLLSCKKSRTEHKFSGPPAILLRSPKEGEVLPTQDVTIKFKLKNFVAYEGGPHLHIFLDDQPYVSYEKSVEPYTFRGVRPGAHAIRIVLTKANGESYKNPEAFALVNFYVLQKTDRPLFDLSKPILTVNLPHTGYYKGWLSDKIEFDFLLRNIALRKDGPHLRYTLDGLTHDLFSPEPVFWTNARRIGTHHLKVELLDANNNPIKSNPFLTTKREFTVVE